MCDSGALFSTVLENFNVSSPLAVILDELRLLTSSITNFFSSNPDPEALIYQNQSIIISNDALHIHKSALSLPPIPLTPLSPPSHLISEILRITTIIYTTALASSLPISSVYTPDLRLQVSSIISKVKLSDWKQIPGVFLWVLLVASPGSGTNVFGRLIRTNETLTAIYIGLKHFGLVVSCLRNFWVVQRWILNNVGRGMSEVQSS